MILSKYQIEKREYWVNYLSQISGNFGIDANKVENALALEIKNDGIDSIIGHLRFCGAIPEQYKHDSTIEKLYSKYTDVVIHEAFKNLGFTSLVLKERAGVADVECVSKEYSFVADAKAFRLSRTAKNQKDFKVQAMDSWKNGKPYAILVAPIYQIPTRTSQIYHQAVTRSVCIFTYTHLAVLNQYTKVTTKAKARKLLLEILNTIDAMNPLKSAIDYWQTINKVILAFDTKLKAIWEIEKKAIVDTILIVQKEALKFLASERERIMSLSKEEAIKEVLRASKLDKKIKAIKSVKQNDLLNLPK